LFTRLPATATTARIVRQHERQGLLFDNACAESVFHSLKVEAIHGERFATRESMRQVVFEYIETDYNPVRLHSSNSFQSPIEFETNFK